ncbi:MAG: FAD-dependent oxidoreductase [Acidobacteriia bacterium]|nr:FAD-dependent oxidoreductase [Terriglobia bacterium]
MNRRHKLIAGTVLGLWLYAPAGKLPSVNAQTNVSTPPHSLSIDDLARAERSYDVVVAGGSAGGAAAALQARRMGSSVALFAETNALGGQLLTVPSIDEGWMSRGVPSGIYGELVDRVNKVYATKGMSIGGCYWDSAAHCYEPHIVNQQLTAMLREANVEIFPRATVKNVILEGNTVLGVEFTDLSSPSRIFGSKVLVDATEYGDVIPRTGAAHFVGNGTGNAPGTCVQSITYAVPTKYYEVVPPWLRLPHAPPNYDTYKPEFQATVSAYAGNSLASYPISFLNHNIYRAMPDFARGLSARVTPPKSSINWANDYLDSYTYVKGKMPPQYFHLALDGRFLTDEATRAYGISEAKLKTLAFLYYIQDAQGLNDQHWAIADDEFGDVTTADDLSLSIPGEFKTIESLMPPFPYVRESRRIQAVTMLTADGIRRTLTSDGFWRGPVWTTAIAFGDYGTDIHNCNWQETLEPWSGDKAGDLDMPQGPFQVPFGSFIPVKVDGFLAAEKNLGYSRLASSALRQQASVMSTGQAAGAIGALAVRHNVQPRAVSPLEVQMALVNSGARISMYAHDDVPYGSTYWSDVQIVGARGIMVGSSYSHFSAADSITRREAAVSLSRMLGYIPVGVPVPVITNPTFADVKVGDWGLPYVEALAAHGISLGCSDKPRKFCPDDKMSREQLAASLARGAALPLGPPGGTGMFSDVDDGFQHYVEAVVRAGFMDPCGAGRFCGASPALRAADFAHGVVRTLSLIGVR